MIFKRYSIIKLLFLTTCFVGLFFLSVFLHLIYLEAYQTKNMRYLKSVFEGSASVEKYSIGRYHEDNGWAEVWLNSGEYIRASVSRENIAGEKWYVTNFGYYKCEEGRFEVFRFSEHLLGSTVENWNEILGNASKIIERLEERPGVKIGDCTPQLYYDREAPPEENEWNVSASLLSD